MVKAKCVIKGQGHIAGSATYLLHFRFKSTGPAIPDTTI